ncbi:MAG: thermonuclease family protein [Niabella sp.]|nr:thermonuclease family protein [Niabella sp.]
MLKVFFVSKYFLLLTVLAVGRCNPDAKEIVYKQNISVTQNLTRYKVIGVKDGDTFVLLMDGKEQVVRLAHIDCPEKRQPYGNNAKQFVSDRCFGKYVRLLHANRYDRNNRLLAEVLLEDGTNLNKALVKNGLAWHFKKYSGNREYAALETAARQQKRGLWVDEDPVAPWNWRHPKKRL